MRLWGGRMSTDPNPGFAQLNASLRYDVRLYAEDIQASKAWAAALQRAGILTEDESEAIQSGLDSVTSTFEDGSFEPLPTDEDIHTAVERLLTERIGSVGGKLHTGRSRNDQVATDFRLWVMRACDRIDAEILELAGALLQSAEEGLTLAMPGYTHMRPAQPITWGHWALAAFWPLVRGRDRFAHARSLAAALPLGSAALAGTAYPIDRQMIAKDLGFESVIPNSIDAISDRDFALEFLFAAASLGVNLSRFAEALILYSGSEFQFIELDDAYVTGSSIMPHKKNPDALELTRGKAGGMIGHLVGLLTTLKGLPSAYDKDLQEDKQPVFDVHDTLMAILPVLTGLIQTMRLRPERMAQAIAPELMAVDLADYLVGKGVPFREAHDVVSKAVRLSEAQEVSLAEAPPEFFEDLHKNFEGDVIDVFNVQESLERRSEEGGTAFTAVRSQLDAAKSWLKAAQRAA